MERGESRVSESPVSESFLATTKSTKLTKLALPATKPRSAAPEAVVADSRAKSQRRKEPGREAQRSEGNSMATISCSILGVQPTTVALGAFASAMAIDVNIGRIPAVCRFF